jgi:hypothetical protein
VLQLQSYVPMLLCLKLIITYFTQTKTNCTEFTKNEFSKMSKCLRHKLNRKIIEFNEVNLSLNVFSHVREKKPVQNVQSSILQTLTIRVTKTTI